MILIVSMNKDTKIETKVVPSTMETVIRRLMEKYEQAQDMVFINRPDTWAVWKVLKEMRGDLKQEPKTGHWIQTNEFFINQDGQFIYQFICSECRSLSYFRKSNKKAIGANVCPNCGADMREGEA